MDDMRLQLLVVAADNGVQRDVQDGLQALAVGADLYPIPDAEAAMAFLRNEEPYDSAPAPDLVLLDLDMLDGAAAAVFDAVAADPNLERVAIVPLAGDIESAAASLAGRRVHEILAKPPTTDGLARVLSYLDER
jgi:response regulator RpfG family c-di-GMP phosphodiesterase